MRICDNLKLQSSEACSKLKVRHLLEFSSGLDFHEVYENESNQASSVLAMLYGEGHKDLHMASSIRASGFRHSSRLPSLACCSVVALALMATQSQAALTISAQATSNVTCSGNVCSATAA